ncbi:hypothetical protein NC651_031376 [Populus alba x Populus x berolinensis]|nr:hypothetical protein NC651_031058 [Populus alba x Populus x berolinensis]KAJ6872249.1 hypothetical protein NC651_031376 [Populus alba x Populus x berolinensis]
MHISSSLYLITYIAMDDSECLNFFSLDTFEQE